MVRPFEKEAKGVLRGSEPLSLPEKGLDRDLKPERTLVIPWRLALPTSAVPVLFAGDED